MSAEHPADEPTPCAPDATPRFELTRCAPRLAARFACRRALRAAGSSLMFALDTLPTVPPAILVGVLIAASIVLGFALRALVRGARGAEMARLPVVGHQEVAFGAPGAVTLFVEGPRFTRGFRNLDVRLVDRLSGTAVAERRLLVPTTVAGWSRGRLALQRFDIERAGVHRLEVNGLEAGRSYADCALVFAPAGGLALAAAIVAAMLAGTAVVASVAGLGFAVLGSPDRAIVAAVPDAAHAPVAVPAPGDGHVASSPLDVGQHGGRQLPSAAADVPMRAVVWEGARLALQVPAGWEVRTTADELDVRDPARPSTYLVGHVTRFPPPTTADVLARVAVESAAGRHRTGLVDGFTAVRFGRVAGVLVVESRRDGASRMAIWTGYRPTATGVLDVTVIFGAAASDFDRLAGVAAAVFASARFADEGGTAAGE